MRVKGHCLVWHNQLPKDGLSELSTEELRIELRAHIRTVVGRYRGRIAAWDVVNEALADDGSMRRKTTKAPFSFFERLGPSYIADAFRWAHEADPAATLLYNDYGVEEVNTKSDAMFSLLHGLLADGVPVHGVGLQGHFKVDQVKVDSVRANVARLGALGLSVNLSEVDVRGVHGAAEGLRRQCHVVHELLSACLAEPAFTGVTFWGVTDRHSWVHKKFGEDDPLLFDRYYQPKPMYHGCAAALAGRDPGAESTSPAKVWPTAFSQPATTHWSKVRPPSPRFNAFTCSVSTGLHFPVHVPASFPSHSCPAPAVGRRGLDRQHR